MKKLFFGAIILISMLSFSVSALADTTTYNIDEIGISVDIPTEYSVFTRHIDDNDPNIEKLGLIKDSVVSYLESGNMYLMAIPDNKQFEIYISMLPTNDTLQTLNDLSQEDLEKMYGRIKDNLSESGVTVSRHSFYDNSGLTFIEYDTQKSGIDYVISHSTIHDYKTISVILRPVSGQFTDEQRAEIGEIAKSIKFTLSDKPDVSSEPKITTPTTIDYVLQFLPIIIIILIIATIVFLRAKKRNQEE